MPRVSSAEVRIGAALSLTALGLLGNIGIKGAAGAEAGLSPVPTPAERFINLDEAMKIRSETRPPSASVRHSGRVTAYQMDVKIAERKGMVGVYSAEVEQGHQLPSRAELVVKWPKAENPARVYEVDMTENSHGGIASFVIKKCDYAEKDFVTVESEGRFKETTPWRTYSGQYPKYAAKADLRDFLTTIEADMSMTPK